jgi:LysM repeat protein
MNVKHRSARPMAVPMGAQAALPMAVPLSDLNTSRVSLMLASGALVLALAGLWRQEQVVTFTRVALDGLGAQEVFAPAMDGGDVPAMDPSLALVVDPRPKLSLLLHTGAASQPKRSPVQPFEYEVQPGETLDEIAARFGTDASAVLWNNGLDSADQLEAGDRLTILPVRGLLHLVKSDETLDSIAERYGARPEDLAMANALDYPGAVALGQVIVVAGGKVPLPVVAAAPTPAPASDPLAAIAAIVADPQSVVSAILPGFGAPAATPTPAPSPDDNLPDPPGASRSQREFILSIAPGARQSQRETGVPASVTLAQAILESDWGRSRLTTDAKNLFGIKAFGHPGTAGVYDANTWEVSGGQNMVVSAGFKAYTSLADSIVDHGHWFIDNSRYAPALAVRDDPRAFARAIADAGYATDPSYAPKLITLMDRFDLYAYDMASQGE